jgi:photosystem II stability/assembly factor-like uncharacterized protein
MTSPTTQYLTAVWAAGPNDAFAVGYGGTILRYNGALWESMTSGVTAALNGVHGTSPTQVFAVGNGGTILKFGPP